MNPRTLGYLLVGIGLVIFAKVALPYVLPPVAFQPGAPQVIIVLALAVAVVVSVFRRVWR